MHTINAQLLARWPALGERKNESTENAHEGMREEITVNHNPTETFSERKREKVRDFRHQQQDIDDYELSPGRQARGKTIIRARARAHGAMWRVVGGGRARRGRKGVLTQPRRFFKGSLAGVFSLCIYIASAIYSYIVLVYIIILIYI